MSDAKADNFEACAERCRATEGCRSITFRPSDSNCWLKNRNGGGGPNTNNDLVSMNVDCRPAAEYKVEEQLCVEENIDYPGADIKDFKVSSLDECRILCNDYDGCKSITFRPSDNNCWLKNAVNGGGRVARDGLVSVNVPCFVRTDCRRHNVDYPGADMSDAKADNFEACAERCRTTDGCRSITFRPSDSNCWLKNRDGGGHKKHSGGRTSMNMQCAGDSAGAECEENNVDYPGADIKDFKVFDINQCRQLCNDDDGCKSITFRPSDNNCWLKNAVNGGGRVARDGLVSANVPCFVRTDCRRHNVDYPGADMSDAKADNFEACAERCRATEGCRSITFRPSDSNCWLKNRDGGGAPNPAGGLISMNMQCAGDSAGEGCAENNVDYPGADIKNFQKSSISTSADSFCNDDDGCQSITFRPSDNNCWLKERCKRRWKSR